jgi:lytic murein transglycosylase
LARIDKEISLMRALSRPPLALTILLLAAMPASADFASCVAGLRSHALGQGISGATFDRTMNGVEPDMKIIELMNSQPEFKTPIWDYLATLVDDQKVAEGRAMLRQHANTLARIEQTFGVDRHAVVAVWGVESDFGQVTARWSLAQALSTAACFGTRRRDFFRGELVSTLKIIQRGDIAAEKLRGSWAGAFGHTQFIPSTYLRLAVDFDGDGRRDLVDSIPDALASTANYLKKSGWINGASWGYEVRLPSGYSGPSGRKGKQSTGFWSGKGITKVDGSGLSGLPAAGLLLPAGRNGPAFLVTRNFDAAYAYNAAESYALAISVLSDRLRGRPGVRGEWPTDDRGLSRAERKELQERLTSRGYDVGKPDGAIGALTRAAIKDVEAKLGMAPTGRPGGKVFDAVR